MAKKTTRYPGGNGEEEKIPTRGSHVSRTQSFIRANRSGAAYNNGDAEDYDEHYYVYVPFLHEHKKTRWTAGGIEQLNTDLAVAQETIAEMKDIIRDLEEQHKRVLDIKAAIEAKQANVKMTGGRAKKIAQHQQQAANAAAAAAQQTTKPLPKPPGGTAPAITVTSATTSSTTQGGLPSPTSASNNTKSNNNNTNTSAEKLGGSRDSARGVSGGGGASGGGASGSGASGGGASADLGASKKGRVNKKDKEKEVKLQMLKKEQADMLRDLDSILEF